MKQNNEMKKELNMDEIHAVTLDVLKKIDELTTELGLPYYMAYGSLIGVVRHQGFIPWDDDLDIMMHRADYEKFLDYCINHEEELYPYRLLSIRNNENYPHMIARLCNVEYPVVVNNEIPCGMGVFVDIYPLDGMGSDLEQLKPAVKRSHRLVDMDFWATRLKFEKPKKWYRIPDKFVRYCYSKLRGKAYIQKELEKMGQMFPYEDSKYIGVITWGSDMMPFEKEYFASTVRMLFETMEVPVPVEYKKVLEKLYGNYMEMPPVEKRCPQHNYSAYVK